VFAGGFTMEMAQAVASDAHLDEWAVLDQLSALVDKSLVVADTGEAPRYRLLESARAFALEQLAAGETADMLRRHAVVMRDFLQRIDDANLDGELRTDQFAARVLPELDNLRAAHAWAIGEAGDPQIAIGLAAHAGALIDYVIECGDWLVPLQGHVERDAVEPALAARYWRALAASNMVGRVSRAVQAEAASRARDLYQALGKPRRVFTSLVQLSRHASALRRDAAGQAAVDEARGLLQPDWPAEFRILLLRRDGTFARDAGRFTEALALMREAARISATTGDWRLEVIDRSNLVDTLWYLGPIEEAAREVRRLVDELRTRPAADADMTVAFANAIGILSETVHIGEAVRAAHDSLPLMRRARSYFVEEWAYLFWRRGQCEAAARLIGASDAQCEKDDTPRQPNEERLIAQARADLEAKMGVEAFAGSLGAGARLGEAELIALSSESLAQPAED
jgi:hypothetical protein